jgi:predicted CXXCH cytochrome family protein
MRKNRVLISIISAAAVLTAVCAVSAPKAKPKPKVQAKPTAASAGYVGTKQCLACHIKFSKSWPQIPHNKILTAASRKPDEAGCEACHGPGKTHATSDRSKIVKFDPDDTNAADSVCLKCHQLKIASAAWKSSAHAKIGLGCLTCHEPHNPKVQAKMLRNKGLANCDTCHGAIIQAASEGKHHKIPAGVQCTQCHTPHGSEHAKGLVKAKDELCKGCHGGGGGKPASHNEADFKKTHGKIAKADDSSCKSCHDKEKSRSQRTWHNWIRHCDGCLVACE